MLKGKSNNQSFIHDIMSAEVKCQRKEPIHENSQE